MQQPALNVGAVTITSEPQRARELADFYRRLLGWPIVDVGPKGGWVQLRPPEGETGPTINIEEDVAHSRPVWPSQHGRQTATMHLDIGVDDLEAAVAWAIEAGASQAEHQPQQHVRVMLDPHGHPFCLC
ncbi:VOC family protein [Microlunatus elymi]|uniref:VOC family protein n=1 Tax=Microlunatus elymi TaxID=2596828 RepID=A0A516PVZ8_9ACTN|nr:VOC family protein [Microlunatus elymi]QDP95329.1 VOC family protein [Microlunatus elymi]